MRRKKYTITDLSRALGVSRATISRAITGSPGVSEEVRNRILSYAYEIGYLTPKSQNSYNAKQSGIIALVLGDIRNPFYADLAFSIQRQLQDSPYTVMIFNSEYDGKRELDLIRLSQQYQFAGLILITAQNEETAPILEDLPIPKVLVNRILPNYKGDSVLTDNFQAGYGATLHLIELGHREIGFIKGQANSSAANQRFAGYRQALQNFSLPFYEKYVFHSDLKMETGYQISQEYLAMDNRPSAMLAINDLTAIGFMDGCRKGGLSIPGDLSLVSFDNISFSSLHSLQLTTMDQHYEQMSREAVRLIRKQLEHPEARSERIILKPQLVIRNTTGAYSY